MRMIALIATESLVYGNRPVGAGERFDATPIDAAVLTYRRRAAFAPRGQVAPPPAPPVAPDPEPPPVRRVRRVAVDEAREPESLETDTESPARRRYRRRDLEPEA
jgi:hypothetical protein